MGGEAKPGTDAGGEAKPGTDVGGEAKPRNSNKLQEGYVLSGCPTLDTLLLPATTLMGYGLMM